MGTKINNLTGNMKLLTYFCHMETVSVSTGKTLYKTTIHAGDHVLISDEPLEHGGKDEGATPSELLLASLGACTAITLRMYANRKAWPLEKVEINLSIQKDMENGVLTTTISREISVEGDLTVEQRQRLLTIANA